MTGKLPRRFLCVKGSGLLSALVASIILGSVALFFVQLISSTLRSQRYIQSNADLMELTGILRTTLYSKESCAQSGLIGVNLSSLLIASPGPLEVSIRLPTGGTPGAVLAEAGFNYGARRIRSATLSDLIAAISTGPGIYSGALALNSSSSAGGILAEVEKQNRIGVFVKLDASHRIISCSIDPNSLVSTSTSTLPLPSSWSCEDFAVAFTGTATGSQSAQMCPDTFPFLRGVVVSQEKRADDTDLIKKLSCCKPGV